MKKAFVTGWPIAHSKSPILHGYWLEHYKINGSYDAVAIPPDDLSAFFQSLTDRGFAGGNITIPHKETAFELIADIDEAARCIGAVNTVWLENGKLKASNTDAYGFSANLDDHAPDWRNGERAVVVGAGGASRAIVFALVQAGFKNIDIVNRTFERAQTLARQFGLNCKPHEFSELGKLLESSDLVINTTSIGMKGYHSGSFLNLDDLAADAIVTDIVYTPLKTPFLAEAEQRGNPTVDGLGMLLHQAVPGFEKWYGLRPQVTEDLRKRLLDI